MKTKTLILMAMVAVPMAANAVTLYDHSVGSGFGYNAGNGSTDGGVNDLGANSGLQVGQLFTAVAGGTVVTDVEATYVGFGGTNSQAYVEIYDASGNTLVASSGLIAVADSTFSDGVFGLVGHTVKATGLSLGGLTAGTTYMMSMQSVGPNWYYITRDANGAVESFGRDFSHFGYGGGYGTTNWTSMGAFGFGDGQVNMKINAVPEPVSMIALGAGLVALARKRRK